ncbi:MAG: hypothetical protein QOE75_1362 [Solirubrobacterales bacterium]|jgi:AcrR family transcriptional regulator|nr:hypothetical protein [Solirubrobacterales bacterium]
MATGNAGSIKPPGGGIRDPGLEVLTPSERDRILAALTECCAESGYQGTSIEQVLARAGVARETFDLLFADKEACAIAALNQLASEVLTTAATAGRGSAGALDQELAGLRAALELIAGQPASAYLGCVEARQGGTERLHFTYEASLHLISVMVSRAHVAAVGAALPAPATRAALGGAEALVRREVVAGRAAQLPRLLPALVYGTLAPLLGQAEALRLGRAAAASPPGGRH